MNRAKMLPDAYAKSTSSNNYKLLQLLNLLLYDTTADLLSIENECCLKNARGAILDEYGWMYGQPRNGLSDEQYRVKILGKISRMLSKGSCDEVISLIANMLGAEPSAISIDESDMTVVVYGLTIDMLENTNYKSSEITGMIHELIPTGVMLADPVYAGTLLVMGDVVKISDTEVCSVDRNGNYQFVSGEKNSLGSGGYGVDYEEVIRQYPTLRCAVGYGWAVWQRGLSGDSIDYTVTEQTGEHTSLQYPWKCNTPMGNRTFEGGTLGLVSGEDA